jgi:hypothetical protein
MRGAWRPPRHAVQRDLLVAMGILIGRDIHGPSRLAMRCDRRSDRGTDILDCVALAPSATELDEALPWVSIQDANPLWPEHVRQTFENLRERLGHGV